MGEGQLRLPRLLLSCVVTVCGFAEYLLQSLALREGLLTRSPDENPRKSEKRTEDIYKFLENR